MPSGAVADDLSWQKFGLLTVIRRVPNRAHQKSMWLCKCMCGNETIGATALMRCGKKTSCGCLSSRLTFGDRVKTHGHSAGGAVTSEYRIWHAMMQRCQNPTNVNYARYGGRGITICERWQKFENFYADMGNRPSPKHSIDRENNDDGYRPGNCRWATATEQARNARSNIVVRFRGRDMCLSEAAEVAGVNYQSLYTRVARLGWDIDRAVKALL